MTKDLHECTGIIMVLQAPMMIIYRREFLVISGVFSNHWITRLRDQRCFKMVLVMFGNIGVLLERDEKVLI
jgi:hypothetical protein